MKRWVSILIGIVLIAFGVGLYSLIYYDGFSFSNYYNLNHNGVINIKSKGSQVKIGSDGIKVDDGDDHVSISWSGIEVRDGNDHMKVGLDGITINDENKTKVNFGNVGKWFGFSSRNLIESTLNEEKFEDIDGINSIEVSSSFVDIKVTSEERDDVRVNYYGRMKSNVIPVLETKKNGKELVIKLTAPITNSYTVTESNAVLEVFIPETFKGDISVSTSSGDIFSKNIIGNVFNFDSSSGDIDLSKINSAKINISTSSGDIKTNELIGGINASSSSGDIGLTIDNSNGNVNLSTSSGDVSVIVKEGASYSVTGNTSSGSVNYNGPVSINKDKSGKFDFTLGRGDNILKVNTSSGDIEFSNK